MSTLYSINNSKGKRANTKLSSQHYFPHDIKPVYCMAHQPLNPRTKTGKRHPKYVESILTALVKADRTSSLLYLGKKANISKLQPIQHYAITVSGSAVKKNTQTSFHIQQLDKTESYENNSSCTLEMFQKRKRK